MKNETLILVDGSNFAHRAYHAHKTLWYRKEQVGIIYGLPGMINTLIFNERPSELIIVWDGEMYRSKHRLKIYPSYKGHRTSNRLIDYPNFLKQKRIVRKMLYYLGIPQVLNPDAEADDMIYKLTKIGKKRFHKVVIASGDKDFNQLIDEKVWVLNDRRRLMITLANCKEIFDYEPHEAIDYHTLIGDKSDDIKGYPGIGPVKARELLDAYGSLEDFLDSRDKHSIINRTRLLELKQRNQDLMDLRVYYSKHKEDLETVFYQEDSNPPLQKDKFIEVCERFNMKRIRAKNFIEDFVDFKLSKG